MPKSLFTGICLVLGPLAGHAAGQKFKFKFDSVTAYGDCRASGPGRRGGRHRDWQPVNASSRRPSQLSGARPGPGGPARAFKLWPGAAASVKFNLRLTSESGLILLSESLGHKEVTSHIPKPALGEIDHFGFLL